MQVPAHPIFHVCCCAASAAGVRQGRESSGKIPAREFGKPLNDHCGVVQVRTLEDATCARPHNELCSDCDASVCSGHAERRDLCRENFCPSCLFFHQAKHVKPAFAERCEPEKRKRA